MWNHFGRKEILLQLCVVEGANILDQGVNSSSTAYKESDQIGFSGLLDIGPLDFTTGTLRFSDLPLWLLHILLRSFTIPF